MFLKKTLEQNEALVDCAVKLHQSGLVMPDTYIVDLDSLYENARRIQSRAREYDITLYFMLKQLGHNPEIARGLQEMGYAGAVAVDFRGALNYMRNGIKLGHVGHLVQIPFSVEKKILAAKPEIVTVFSLEKAREIDAACSQLGIVQDVMLRVTDRNDVRYAGQEGGFELRDLEENVGKLKTLGHIRITGLTSFPCFLFDEKRKQVVALKNTETILEAKRILSDCGIEIVQCNMPSANCTETIPLVKESGGTHAEPGHGLTGTTPLHAVRDCSEKPAVVYVTEVSHNYDGKAYCYGGGYYRRSHVANAVTGIGKKRAKVLAPDPESIDYYFCLDREESISETVVMAFRTQIFVTRSMVVLVEGISKGSPRITGAYSAEGIPLQI
jgi:predicted amino acid racemase